MILLRPGTPFSSRSLSTKRRTSLRAMTKLHPTYNTMLKRHLAAETAPDMGGHSRDAYTTSV
jgi:hypothetical protein